MAGKAAHIAIAAFSTVADISVVANQAGATQASSAVTLVRRGTDITVVAGRGIGKVCASTIEITGIIGAGVAVVAVYLAAAPAFAVTAGFVDSAGVAVITGEPLSICDFRTGSSCRITDCGQTGWVWTFRVWAGHLGARFNDAEVWYG